MPIRKMNSLASLTHSVKVLIYIFDPHLTGAFVQKRTGALTLGHRTVTGVGTLTPDPVNSEAQATVTMLNSEHSTLTCTSFENGFFFENLLGIQSLSESTCDRESQIPDTPVK